MRRLVSNHGQAVGRTLVLIVLTVVLLHPAVSGAEPIVSAGSATVNVSDVFTISVSIANAAELTGWQFDLSFDPAILHANSVTEGPLMSSFGATLFAPGVIDDGSGLISLVADFYVDLPPNPSGSGVLANIEFQALTLGVSTLTLSSAFLNFSDSGFLTENGRVTVLGQGVDVPEPNTLTLLSVGLGALAARRWRTSHRAPQTR